MTKRYRIAFLLLFFVSGFSGLIYESIWTHYLKLFLGHAAYAQTLVLVIFMGGLAIGSYLASRYSWKWKNLFLTYAIAEGIIGLLALVFHESFTSLLEISFTTVFQNLGSPLSINLYKWGSAACLILPQSILLGMTFPLMSAAILRAFPSSPGKNISLLYFTNSFGAAIGVLVSGFYFIDAFGLPGTIRIAGVINILIALVILILIKRNKQVIQSSHELSEEKHSSISKDPSNLPIVLLSVSAFTGMASFIYEIGWIRMLNMVLGTSTHAFELMLSAFILGLAFGGLWIRKRIDRMTNPIAFLAYVQLIMGVLALSTLLLYGSTFNIMQWLLEILEKDANGYLMFNLTSNGIALLIMFPTTFCAGMTLPIITTILLKLRGEKSIGAVYAWNTIGAIVGVIIAVNIGMPLLGLKGLISLGAGIDIVLGLILLFVFCSRKTKFTIKAVASSIGVLALLYSIFFVHLDPYKMASGVFRGIKLLTTEDIEILFHKDGKTATSSVLLHKKGQYLSIRTNGKADASLYVEKKGRGIIDEVTMIQIASIPMALNPEAKHVANIGLGAGITTKIVLDNPQIQSIHTIEIEEQMVEAAKYFGEQVAPVFSDPRSTIIIDDAKSYFASGHEKYDIILSEPSNSWVSGVSGLFSKEFYGLIKQHLNQGGVFAQWLQLYNLDLELAVSVLKAVSQSFPDYEVYILDESNCLIVAKKDGLLPPLSPEIFSSPAIASELRRIDVNNVQDVQFRLLGNKKVLDPFLTGFSIPANSDYYPVLDQNATRARFLRKNAKEVYSFTHQYHSVISMLSGEVPQWDTTRITPNSFYRRAQSANEAMALRDFYLYDNFDLHYPYLPNDLRNQAKLLKNSLASTSYNMTEEIRIPLLYNTSVRMTPFLTSFEMKQVWASLGDLQNPNLGSREMVWMSIFQAEAKRDAKTMVSAGEYLLINNPILHIHPKEYLVSTVMLGYIMQGELDEAQLVWRTYEGSLSDDPQSKMLFRFLAASCKKD